jgi:hypothetical protein
MRRFAIAGLLAIALVGVLPGVAGAAPSNGFALTFTCDDGSSMDLNFGAPPNQSSTAFVVGDNAIFVAKHLELVVEGEVVYSWDRGINGFGAASLLTCSGDFGDTTFVVVGYLTPRG